MKKLTLYANFYDKKDRCLYSVKVKDEKEAYARANYEYDNNASVADWTLTDRAMSKEIIA